MLLLLSAYSKKRKAKSKLTSERRKAKSEKQTNFWKTKSEKRKTKSKLTSTCCIKLRAEISNEQYVFWTQNQGLWAIQYLLISIQNQQIHNHQYLLPISCHPKHCCKNVLTVLHFASNVSVLIRALLNQEQENWLTTSVNGVISNFTCHWESRATEE